MEKLICQTGKIGTMTLKNRIIMPPMVVRYASDDGFITERSIDYYEARAKGGVSLVIVEAAFVRDDGILMPNQVGISHDTFIPKMKELVAAVHRHDVKIAVQLVHGGMKALTSVSGQATSGGVTPQAMTMPEISGMVQAFVRAALRAKEAGFDGVEIHGAHGFLLSQFLSASTNSRGDAYGGSLENRARFLIEVISEARKAVGADYPLWCRINGREYGVTNGITLQEAMQTARMAEAAGADAIHVSATGPESPVNDTTPVFEPAMIADLAAGIKRAVKIPVIAVGRMTPDSAEDVLKEKKADFIAFGRALLADPDLPEKVCTDTDDAIRHCILCMRCRDSLHNIPGLIGVQCSVNAALGRERELAIIPADTKKRVLVVGGGPGGMEAARIAALRGHDVTLWEKKDTYGGQLVSAAMAPHKDRIGTLTSYYRHQLAKLGVDVQTGKEATVSTIVEFDPDALVLATGGKALTPDIPGLDESGAVHAVDVLEGKACVGERVAVIGAELVACELAEFLAAQGKRVTIMRRGGEVAAKVGPALRVYLLPRLRKEGVEMLTGIRYVRATDKGLEILTGDGARRLIAADSIVIAAGAEPEQTLFRQLKGTVSGTYQAGDCVAPRTVMEAISEGYRAGLEI